MPAAHARMRSRRLLASIAAGAGARGLGLIVQLLMVTIVIAYVGVARYGILVTIRSGVALLGFLDLGIGNSLVHGLPAVIAADQRSRVQSQVRASFVLLLVASVSILAVAVGTDVTGVLTKALGVGTPVAFAYVCCLAAGLPWTIGRAVRLAYQEAFITSAWDAGGSVASLLAVLVAVEMQWGISSVVWLWAGVPVMATVGNTLVLFLRDKPWIRPFGAVPLEDIREQVAAGSKFLGLQAAALVGSSSDTLIAFRILGPAAVGVYAAVQRLFATVQGAFGLALNPMWPSYRDAVARRDGAWVRQALWRSFVAVAIMSATAGATLVVAGPWVLTWWVGGAVVAPTPLLVAFGAWVVTVCLGGVAAMAMNGIGAIGFELIWSVPLVVGAIAGKVIGAREIGLSGIVWANVAAAFLFSGVPYAIYLPRLIARIGTVE